MILGINLNIDNVIDRWEMKLAVYSYFMNDHSDTVLFADEQATMTNSESSL